jgi:hypothetical protein
MSPYSPEEFARKPAWWVNDLAMVESYINKVQEAREQLK